MAEVDIELEKVDEEEFDFVSSVLQDGVNSSVIICANVLSHCHFGVLFYSCRTGCGEERSRNQEQQWDLRPPHCSQKTRISVCLRHLWGAVV